MTRLLAALLRTCRQVLLSPPVGLVAFFVLLAVLGFGKPTSTSALAGGKGEKPRRAAPPLDDARVRHGRRRSHRARVHGAVKPMCSLANIESFHAHVYFDAATVLRQLGIAHDPLSLTGRVATVLNHPLTVGRAVVRQVSGR